MISTGEMFKKIRFLMIGNSELNAIAGKVNEMGIPTSVSG